MFLSAIVIVLVICLYVIYTKTKKVPKVKINGKAVLITGCDTGRNLLYSLRVREFNIFTFEKCVKNSCKAEYVLVTITMKTAWADYKTFSLLTFLWMHCSCPYCFHGNISRLLITLVFTSFQDSWMSVHCLPVWEWLFTCHIKHFPILSLCMTALRTKTWFHW